MDITNPRRILVVGRPDSGVLTFLRDLTGSAPTPVHGDNSIAGLSHAWALSTPYYRAELPIWIDEIADVDAWAAEFSKPEAREVVAALGAWVYCFRKPLDDGAALDEVRATMKAIQRVVEKGAGYGWDGVCLAVAMPQSTTPHLQRAADEWDDECRESGFEFVDAEAKGKNEFGEAVGMARVKEALEANDWAGDETADLDDLEGSDNDEFHSTFAAEEAEMGMELMGMKTAMNGGEEAAQDGEDEDEAAQVEELERMMSKLHGIRDLAATMPEEQRKKFAAKAVNDLMKSP